MNIGHDIEQAYEIKDAVVQVPLHDFEALLAHHIEELKDIATLDQALLSPEETFPGEVAIELLAGNNPLRVYRQYRKLTQEPKSPDRSPCWTKSPLCCLFFLRFEQLSRHT
ncbi:MAG: hypothetical protein KUG79_07545 [Pseudomonadales bacterium]|nr:hypothetical protein [Pseudomonadales bacterium]